MTFVRIDSFHFNLYTKIIIENANQMFTSKSDGINNDKRKRVYICTLYSVHILRIHVCLPPYNSRSLPPSPSMHVRVCVCGCFCACALVSACVCMRACVVQSEKSDKQRFDLDGAALPQTVSKRNFACVLYI